MKYKFARELIEELKREVRQDYRINSERLGMLKADHLRLIQYLGLERKHTYGTIKYGKRRKKNG